MYQRIVLKNGTRLILVPDDHTKAATIFVLYRVGSRYEPLKINGVSHFIEHMMFKGTKRRPRTVDISRELDAHGAEYNAFTGKDVTGYYVKIESRHFGLALDMLHDMLSNSKFEAKELDQERKVIMEEIHMYADNPMMHIEDMIEGEIFRGGPFGMSIAGEAKSMHTISRTSMLAYKNAYYDPARTVVIASGNFGVSALSEIGKRFGNGAKKKAGKEFSRFRGKQTAPRIALEFKETEQAQLALGFPAYSYTDRRLPALSVLGNILGGTMSSRLFITVRERKGLAYYVRAGADAFEDTGTFVVRAGLTKSRIDEAIGVICAELAKVKRAGVTPAELRRAKDNIRGHLALELEDSSDLAAFFGRQELYTGKIKTPEEKMAEIDAVTGSEVRAAARAVIRKEAASLAVIGPFKDEKKLLGAIKL
jgi:predicted Zn-dependent peptidase